MRGIKTCFYILLAGYLFAVPSVLIIYKNSSLSVKSNFFFAIFALIFLITMSLILIELLITRFIKENKRSYHSEMMFYSLTVTILREEPGVINRLMIALIDLIVQNPREFLEYLDGFEFSHSMLLGALNLAAQSETKRRKIELSGFLTKNFLLESEACSEQMKLIKNLEMIVKHTSV